MTRVCLIAAALTAVLATAGPAFAHPHFLINAHMVVGFNSSGELVSVTHGWTFAPASSEYHTAFTYRDGTAVVLEGPPPGCIGELQLPPPIPADLEAEIYSLPPKLTKLLSAPAAALRGGEGAVVVYCEDLAQ